MFSPLKLPAPGAFKRHGGVRPGQGGRAGKPAFRLFSFAILVPLALFLSILLRQTWFQRARNIESYAALDVFNAVQVLVVVCAAGYLLLPEAHFGATLGRLKRSAALGFVGYYLFGCASALWSTSPLYSFYMGAETVVLLLLLLVVFASCRDFYLAEKVAIGVAVLTIGLEMGTRIFRGGLSLGMLHTNTYSCSAAMLLAYGVGEAFARGRGRSSRGPVKLAIAVGGICLIAGTSTGSNIGCFVALCLVVVWTRQFGIKQLMLIGSLCLVAVVAITLEQTEWGQVLLGGKSLEAITSAENRVGLWEHGLSSSLESSILGYGFCVGAKENLQQTNAHNSFLEIALNTGLVGLCLFSIVLAKLALEVRAVKRLERPGALGAAAAFTAVVVNSLSVSVLAFSWTPPGFAFYAFLALFSLYCRPAAFLPPHTRAAVTRPRPQVAHFLLGARRKRPSSVY